jgi:hypothetical protein
MIREVNDVIIDVLRTGMSKLIPPENIFIEEFKAKKQRTISLVNSEYFIEELGIGSSGGIKKEEIAEKFDADGEKLEFKVSQVPVKPIVSVQSPPGTEKKDTDDYTVNYDTGTITFRAPPEKGKDKVLVKYVISKAIAETRYLKFLLNNSLIITSDNIEDRNKLTIESLRVLYAGRPAMTAKGVEEFKLLKGYSVHTSGTQVIDASIIDFQVVKVLEIEIPVPPIERIEIEGMKP